MPPGRTLRSLHLPQIVKEGMEGCNGPLIGEADFLCPLWMKLLDIYEELRSDLKVIEEELAATLVTDQAGLNRSSGHLLEAGGKRIRPLFVLLSGHFGQYDINRLKRVAVPLELIHMATLVHDDVIDDADTRRGRKTVKAQWDNRVAMYTGDYIFARSLQVVTEIEDPAVHRILSRSIMDMCRGEIDQVRDFYDASPSLLRYFRRIKRKTALFDGRQLPTGKPGQPCRRVDCPKSLSLRLLCGHGLSAHR